MRSLRRSPFALLCLASMLTAWLAGGCANPAAPGPTPPSANPANADPSAPADPAAVAPAPNIPDATAPDILSQADLTGLQAVDRAGPIEWRAARNEWTSTIIRITPPQSAAGPLALTLPVLGNGGRGLDASVYRAYQLLPVPLDVDRAGFVRQTGASTTTKNVPRALLPLQITDGRIDLTQLRDPRKPADFQAKGLASGQPLLVWIDVHIPVTAPPGHFDGQLFLSSGDPKSPAIAALRAGIDIYDFVLPDDRHLNMVGEVQWDSLQRFWPDRFEVIRPRLLSRLDPNQKAAIKTLDQLMSLAQEHRVQIHVPRLQPTVKWPSGQPVQIDWQDYDSLVAPWLSGDAFADHVPLGAWALPKIDFLDNIPAAARLEYYAAAAAHFDQRDWLRVSPVVLSKDSPGRASVTERLLYSAEASRILRAHPRVRVRVPLQSDEIQLAGDSNPNLIDAAATGRLNCVAPGLISSSSMEQWPANLQKPQFWLRTDLAGLIPYVGAGGDETDVRVWSWVAFLRHANAIQWDNALPKEPDLSTPADPTELTWFYPGSWFGVDDVLPTVQLKWLRQAQQDYEYLLLAEQRGSLLNVLPMARLLAKPVEIQPGQAPDPTYSLLIGTASHDAWHSAKPLIARIIESRGPGITPDENAIAALNLDTLRWMEPLERPVILPRTTQWTVGAPPPGEIGPWVNLRLGIDLYNASDTTPVQNELGYEKLIAGWEVQPQPVQIPKLLMYQVARQYLTARLDPSRITPNRAFPVAVAYRSGETGQTTPMGLVAPVSRTVRRVAPLSINGSLDDWTGDDALLLGPLVKMMDRPSVQAHSLNYAASASELYSGWTDDKFLFAFRVEGLGKSTGVLAARNFIDYQDRRAWGEDVCQIIAQAMYDDGSTGPLVHIAVKPGGNLWVERQLDPKTHVEPWQDFESGVRYASTAEGQVWRGEMSIPWKALIDPDKTAEMQRQGKPNVPTMLKFNFIQHKRDTGESSSWAGPIDYGRSDAFTGVLVLKEPEK
ncbi:MAG: hypothetical protein ACTHLZ_08400 [Tepidisphaeraceae bacterium]